MHERATARQLDDLYALLLQRLSPRRIFHTIGAAHVAVRLAVRWNASPAAALIAALLHDVAKDENREALAERIEGDLGNTRPEDLEIPSTWHAVAGEIIARREFGVSPEIGGAILLHPTGDAEMGLLAQIIFLADYIEPMRAFDGVRKLRQMAGEDLAAAVDAAILLKTSFVEKRGKPLHKRSERAREAARRRFLARIATLEGKGA
jgi:nicotinate-nucleotide adenylyltransferase